MAEALLRRMAGDDYEVFSAGAKPTGVHPLAIRAMAEVGIDISTQRSKSFQKYLQEPFDYVITVCDQAREECPIFPGAKNQLHWSFDDPSRAQGSEEEQLGAFRRVRDAIRQQIQRFLAAQEHALDNAP